MTMQRRHFVAGSLAVAAAAVLPQLPMSVAEARTIIHDRIGTHLDSQSWWELRLKSEQILNTWAARLGGRYDDYFGFTDTDPRYVGIRLWFGTQEQCEYASAAYDPIHDQHKQLRAAGADDETLQWVFEDENPLCLACDAEFARRRAGLERNATDDELVLLAQMLQEAPTS